MDGTGLESLWRATLDRRSLIKLGIAAWLAPARVLAQPRAAWSFAVFSDTHFGIAGNLEKNRAMLEEVAALAPELAVTIGDVTERGWTMEYDDVATGFAGLSFPVRCAPGNHDVRWAPLGLQLFEERVGAPRQVFEHRGCVFALLDSTVPLSHWGHIGGPQRRWLATELERFPSDMPVFVFSHHAPGRTPAAVDDDHALGDVLARFNTKIVFTGHGHADLAWDWRGMTCTMGKGLYQGSFQHVQVDTDAGEVRVYRRTPDGLSAKPFVTLPLRRGTIAAASAPAPTAGEATGALKRRWVQPLGGGVMSHLLLDRGVLYVSAMDGTVQALDAKDGRVRWRATTGGYCHSSPVLAGNLVIVGSADAGAYAFDRGSGRQRWRVETKGPVYASAAVARGIAAIASGDGTTYGIDVKSGKVRWTYTLPPGDSAFSQSPAATDGERIFFGAWDRHVYALDARTGAEVWKYAATPTSIYYSAAIAAPALANGRLYVPSNDNTLHALDARTGAVVWTQKSPGDKFGYSSPTIAGDRIYIGCLGDIGEVRCLAAADGRELWVAKTGSTIYESSPALAGAHVAIGSVNGTLWLLDAASGAITGSYRFPPGHFLASPAAERGRVYAATLAEEVAALDIVHG
jgi:outer membrane protein assembly factor BamB